MNIDYIEGDFTKLCHAKPGQAVTLVTALMERDRHAYLVCVVPDKNKHAARDTVSNGLYDDERKLFLVNLETGELRDMPHLSSRVIIWDDAALRLAIAHKGRRAL